MASKIGQDVGDLQEGSSGREVSRITAPGVLPEVGSLFSQGDSGFVWGAKRVEVEVARDLLEIRILIYEESRITSLIEITRSLMGAIEVGGVGDIEAAHEFLKIAQRGLDQEVEVIGHQDISQNLHLVDLGGPGQELQEGSPVGVWEIDLLASIASAGDMVVGVFVLNAEGMGQGGKRAKEGELVKNKECYNQVRQ